MSTVTPTIHPTLERLVAVEVTPALDGANVDHDRLVTALAEVELIRWDDKRHGWQFNPSGGSVTLRLFGGKLLMLASSTAMVLMEVEPDGRELGSRPRGTGPCRPVG
jgi:hypothetical protein